MTRQEANRLIVKRIADAVEEWPEQRFHQILQNLCLEDSNGTDLWFEESEDTYNSMLPF